MTDINTIDGHVAVLVGNGLSLAFNPKLNVQEICNQVAKRIRNSAKGDTADRIAAALERAAAATRTGDPMEDFEVLVGAFEFEGSFMEQLKQLSELLEPDGNGLREAFDQVQSFSERIRLRGISHVLQVIAERSIARLEDREPISKFVDTLMATAPNGLTIANLNYDTLLLSCLTEHYSDRFCDMGAGYNPVRVTFTDGDEYTVYPLRETGNFPTDVRLLGLHGSLTWWRDPKSGKVFKFPVSAVRDHNMWSWIRSKEAEDELWLPQVVLSNQTNKAGQVAKQPFKLAYEEFSRALDSSAHWLIVGYSFRDLPVNDMLRSAFMKKTRRPKVLIITKGNFPTQESVEHALGWAATDGSSDDWLTLSTAGVVDTLGSADWLNWSGKELRAVS